MPVGTDHNARPIKSAPGSLTTVLILVCDHSGQLDTTEEKLENARSRGSCGVDHRDKVLVNVS